MDDRETWTANVDGEQVECTKLVKRPYENCIIDAGHAEGLSPDTIYLRFQREGNEPSIYFVRPDEALAIIHCLSGTLWSEEVHEP